MNEHTLPDDLSRWPANPFTLLGVSPGADERELRRAYTRLIRTYKPEHFPEQFRRIRAAYEAARDRASFFRAFETPADAPAPPAESPTAARPAPPIPEADDDAPAPEWPASQPPRSLEEELDEAWDWAVAGDEARAYARLLELQNQRPERSEICLRLYCLLAAAPELDGRRTPCDFLAQGLRQSGGGGPCHELYRREIEDNPDEALTERFAGLLRATTQPGLLATFVKWRWDAAGRQGRFEVIREDVPGLRARLAVDQEEIWLRLLAFAADRLAWATDPVGLAECADEIAAHKHLQLRCADVFDRLEYLERVAVGWQALIRKGAVPADLLKLLSRFWTLPFWEVRRGVTAVLAAVAAEPEVWLASLDRINEASPQLLSLFGRVLDSYQETLDLDDDGRDPAELTELARHFLEDLGGLGYAALRPRLLAFCLREVIDPEAAARPAALPEARLNKLANDWPLRHVYRACTLFRN